MILAANDETFAREVLHTQEPSVVEFWAPWCGHCRRLEPVLEALADSGRRVVKVNIDLAPLTARQYGVGSIPALFYFRQGKPGQALLGPGSRGDIEAWLAAQQG